ncbi:Hypothetical predicted protein [Mytilus galloprovincialis]|uniref:Chromo domain-containing protein n=1 Tax=Mytilus galloprovincialis TaxID=29158 RepID=A0A8B6GJD3_MYTGA|nr:Hypothetical predicted protein [Mytilus galloprovincialis]
MDRNTLKDELTELMHGVTRPPALLMKNPRISTKNLNLDSYEILHNEPLHDISNVVKNIIEELPTHIENKNVQNEFEKFAAKTVGEKNQVKGSDARRFVVQLAKFITNLNEKGLITENKSGFLSRGAKYSLEWENGIQSTGKLCISKIKGMAEKLDCSIDRVKGELFLVKWENFPKYDSTWEPAKHIPTSTCDRRFSSTRDNLFIKENCGKKFKQRQKLRKIKLLETYAQKALSFTETFGQKPIKVDCKSESGLKVSFKLGENNEPKYSSEKIEAEDKEALKQILFLLDKFCISDAAFHELSMLVDDMPRKYMIVQCRDDINKIYHIERSSEYRQVRTPNGGGARHINEPKTWRQDDILQHGKKVFFLNCKSNRGKVTDFQFEVRNFMGDRIDNDWGHRDTQAPPPTRNDKESDPPERAIINVSEMIVYADDSSEDRLPPEPIIPDSSATY